VLCAAGYNIRWLLRMISKKAVGLFFGQQRICSLAQIGRQVMQFCIGDPHASGSARLALV